MSLSERVGRTWLKHRTLFWTLHSVWVLATGTLIVMFARERYHLVLWVVLFLALAWASTLYFGRAAIVGAAGPPGPLHEVAPYLPRHLYQETLFFLLPFYAYSTVVGSPNVLFLMLLGGLAVLSCIDLLFDKWLRTRPVLAAPIAASLAVGGAVPLALRNAERRRALPALPGGGHHRPRCGLPCLGR